MARTADRTRPGPAQYLLMGLCVLLALLVSWAMWYLPNNYMLRMHPQRDANANAEGVWDLRDYELETGYAFIRDEESGTPHAPGALLGPDEFEGYTGELLFELIPRELQVATARLRLAMPDDGTYMLAAYSNDYSDHIYVNGELCWAVGQPTPTAEGFVPGSTFIYFEAKAENGIIDIVRQSANFVHKDIGGFTGFFVARPSVIRHLVALKTVPAALGMGVYLCMFVLHLMLYLLMRSYRPNLWFSIICLAWALRTGLVGTKVLTSIFPGMPWAPMYKLGNVSIALTGILLLALVGDEFPGVVQKWPRRIFYGGFCGFILFYLLADTYVISHGKVGGEALLMAAGAYLLLRLVLVVPGQIRSGALHTGQWLTLTGFALVLAGLGIDALYFANIKLFAYEVGEITMLAFVLLQMAALTFGTTQQLARARQDAKIAWESAELARKNEALAALERESLRKSLELREKIIADIPKESLVTCGPLTLNLGTGQAYLNEEDLVLPPKEFGLLHHFIRHEGEAVSRQALYQQVWQQPFAPKDRALESSVYRLRKKLENSGYTIATVRGLGYRMEGTDLP